MRLTQANIYCEKRTLEREKQSGNKFELEFFCKSSRQICAKTETIFHAISETQKMRDWDHKNPSEKTHTISKMNYKSDELFFAEIAKCDILCRNCHIMRTMQQYKDDTIPKRKSTKK